MGHIRDNSIMAAIGRVEARLSRKPVLVIGKREGRARQVIAQLRHLNLRFRVEANLYEGLKELSIDADGWSLAILVADDIGGLPVASRGSFYVATERLFGSDEFEVEYVRDGATESVVFGRDRLDKANAPTEVAGSDGSAEAGSGDMASRLEELEKLGDLRDRGILSEEEFASMKARILEGT